MIMMTLTESINNPGFGSAVMVTPDAKDKWKVEPLTTAQNGDNDSEVERVIREHPGEDECVLDRRVLGALAPFRCKSGNLKPVSLSVSDEPLP